MSKRTKHERKLYHLRRKKERELIQTRVLERLAETSSKQADFQVYVDPVHGVAGTVWPIGTASHPVNNMDDA